MGAFPFGQGTAWLLTMMTSYRTAVPLRVDYHVFDWNLATMGAFPCGQGTALIWPMGASYRTAVPLRELH